MRVPTVTAVLMIKNVHGFLQSLQTSNRPRLTFRLLPLHLSVSGTGNLVLALVIYVFLGSESHRVHAQVSHPPTPGKDPMLHGTRLHGVTFRRKTNLS